MASPAGEGPWPPPGDAFTRPRTSPAAVRASGCRGGSKHARIFRSGYGPGRRPARSPSAACPPPGSSVVTSTTGIDPPLPISSAGLPYSSASAAAPPGHEGLSTSTSMPGAAPKSREVRPCAPAAAVRHETLELFHHLVRVLVRHQPERDLRRRLRRDHRLAAGALIAAPDAVDVGGRPRPQPLQRRIAAFARPGWCRPMSPRNAGSSKPSASHCARCEFETGATLS